MLGRFRDLLQGQAERLGLKQGAAGPMAADKDRANCLAFLRSDALGDKSTRGTLPALISCYSCLGVYARLECESLIRED